MALSGSFVTILLGFLCAASQFPGVAAEEAAKTLPQYKVGDAVPVSCVNRNFETGEHIMDAQGRLQYLPFPTCNETGRPLELYFGQEKDVNCTVEVDDHFFHLLEFYVHNDAPMTCRIPARPISTAELTKQDPDSQVGALGSEDSHYIPLPFALTGILQLSHLHVANNLNILLHAAPKAIAPGVVDSGVAYSVLHLIRNTKITIGESLPLKLSIRWYPSSTLPSGWTGVGGHIFFSTLVYCLLSAGASAAICIAYFRGIDLPRRLKTHSRDRAFTAPRYTGYGYGVGGVGNGYGYAGPGKID